MLYEDSDIKLGLTKDNTFSANTRLKKKPKTSCHIEEGDRDHSLCHLCLLVGWEKMKTKKHHMRIPKDKPTFNIQAFVSLILRLFPLYSIVK